MVILDETEDTPRRVSVKSTQFRLTFAHHPGTRTTKPRTSTEDAHEEAQKGGPIFLIGGQQETGGKKK